MKISSTSFSILNSVYSWPNIFIPIVCGFLLDRMYGIRIGTVILSLILCIGQLIVAFGGMFNKFQVVFTGRVVYG
jgi:dipeptide/tripeptide permease